MKTFGLYLLLFFVITIFLAIGLKDWKTQEIMIQGTLLSFIMYKLIKEETKN